MQKVSSKNENDMIIFKVDEGELAERCFCKKGEESPGFMQAECRITSGEKSSDAFFRESATENIPPENGKGEMVLVRAHRMFGNKYGIANPTRSKAK